MSFRCLLGKHDWGNYRCRRCGKFKQDALKTAFREKDAVLIKKVLKTSEGIAQLHSLKLDNTTPFLWCIENDMPDVARHLLKHGLPAHDEDNMNQSLILLACKKEQTEMIKQFLNYYFDINVCDEHGISPLFYELEKGHVDIVRLMLQMPFIPSHLDDLGRNAFFFINEKIPSNDLNDILLKLIHFGVDINHQNAQGNTPLHYALDNNLITYASLLIDRHCQLDLPNKKNISCRQLISQGNWPNLKDRIS